MVKLVFLCRRRPDITHDRYATLLLDEHVPLALCHHPTMRRYVVNVVEEAAAGAPPLDSIGMLWFDSLADYHERLYDSPEGAEIIARDVTRFLGHADAYATVEQSAESAGRRAEEAIVACLQRPPGMSVADFQARWCARAATPGYVASVVERRLGPTGLTYDGIAEVSGGSLAAVAAAHRDAAGVVHAYRVRAHVARW